MVMRLTPFAGINNVSDDDDLQKGGDSPRLFVKDVINIDISDTGKLALRKDAAQVTALEFKNIWQSPLHKDVFATLNRQIVKVNPLSWDYEVLETNIDDSIVGYEIINNVILISTQSGIFSYNGSVLSSLTIDNPASPMVMANAQGGRLGSGDYTVAIAYMRNGVESGLSEHVKCKLEIDGKADPLQGSLSITLPYCLDESITHVVVYMTSRNGAELKKYQTYPKETQQINIDNVDDLGRAAQFNTFSPMPSGKFMKYWQGRLLTADRNILRFSQAMAYHLHDERHDFVMLPQRITFLLPVDNGIWIGQVDHVVFLSGPEPKDMQFIKKTAHAPIPNTAIEVDADTIGSDISQGGGKTALWLAENGYVLGTSSGQLIELHTGVLKGISAKTGKCVRLDRRITTIVS